jgi:hypothetical protein
MKDKRAVSPDLITPNSICIHMCTLYTYTNTYLPRFSPLDSSGPPSVSSRALSSHRAPRVHCVCARAYTHQGFWQNLTRSMMDSAGIGADNVCMDSAGIGVGDIFMDSAGIGAGDVCMDSAGIGARIGAGDNCIDSAGSACSVVTSGVENCLPLPCII